MDYVLLKKKKKKLNNYLNMINKINYQVSWSIVLRKTTFILKNWE